MKAFIVIVILAAAGFLGWKIKQQWDIAQEDAKTPVQKAVTTPVTPTVLPGMVPSLEATLDASTRRGAVGLRDFLTRYGKTIRDPRLAVIELDYVVLVAKENPAEARKVFARVKQRTPATSPVYPRIKQLANTFD
jgi:hypothetical protein